MLTRAQKEEQVAELKDKFGRATSIYVADYRGLDVESVNQLRRRVRREGEGQFEYRVTKNTVLRRAAGNRESLLGWLDTQPLPVRLSHPDILVTRWRTRWPDDQVTRLCDWNNRPPRVILRVHGARATVDL